MNNRAKRIALDGGRDFIAPLILLGAVLLFVLNGSRFLNLLPLLDSRLGSAIRVAGTALILNVALILFGWRRYVDLQHEAALREEQKRCATVLANTDPITGLYNRKGFADLADHLRADAALRGESLAIVSFQAHRLKALNAQHGTEAGDRLLKTLSMALADAVGSEAVLARLGVDEFAIALALHPEDLASANTLAETVLQTVTRPLLFEERIVQVGAFAGVASEPASKAQIPDVLRRADIAMDHARNGRAARPVWFDEGMERALIAHSEVEQGIRFGLEHHQFVPFFEPQINLETGEIVGFEVLARWLHPLSGVIGPEVFIPVSEEIGLIGRLSDRVIGQALREAATWDPGIKISVNISPLQIADNWLAQRLLKTLAETGFPAERLIVEVTERHFNSDPDSARAIITSLKNQGIGIALDDFGAGPSSLTRLKSLPFDIIKIDRSLVAGIAAQRQNAAMIRAVTTVATSLGIAVYAEGIENEDSLRAVVGLGCRMGQGWYFGKPMPADEARTTLEAHNSLAASQLRSASNG